MYYVYQLSDPRTGKPFYIGKGQGSRIHHHELQAKFGKISRKCDLIREINNLGLRVEKKIVKEFFEETEALAYEVKLISKIGLDKLTNLTKGGEGHSRKEIILEPDVLIAKYFSSTFYMAQKAGINTYAEAIYQSVADKFLSVLYRRGAKWCAAYVPYKLLNTFINLLENKSDNQVPT